MEEDSTYSEEQRQLYKDLELEDLETEKRAKLEILSQKRKDLQTEVPRIKQTIKKVLHQDEIICTLFCEQSITIALVLTSISMIITAIVLVIKLTILSFLNNSVEYVAKHTYALIVFAAGLIGVWMIQKVLA